MRQKLIETGAVDVMIDIRGNFFYTRTVPCQLWFFDRAKEKDEARRDHVLMLDARNIFRKVSRSVCDFSPEQQKNIAAIVWLYRGQQERFLKLVETYLDAGDRRTARRQARRSRPSRKRSDKLVDLIEPFAKIKREDDPLAEPWDELTERAGDADGGYRRLSRREAAAQAKDWRGRGRDNAGLNAARRRCIRWPIAAAI